MYSDLYILLLMFSALARSLARGWLKIELPLAGIGSSKRCTLRVRLALAVLAGQRHSSLFSPPVSTARVVALALGSSLLSRYSSSRCRRSALEVGRRRRPHPPPRGRPRRPSCSHSTRAETRVRRATKRRVRQRATQRLDHGRLDCALVRRRLPAQLLMYS